MDILELQAALHLLQPLPGLGLGVDGGGALADLYVLVMSCGVGDWWWVDRFLVIARAVGLIRSQSHVYMYLYLYP